MYPPVLDLPRQASDPIGWRQDVNGTLSWVEALDGGDGNATVDYRDAVYHLGGSL